MALLDGGRARCVGLLYRRLEGQVRAATASAGLVGPADGTGLAWARLLWLPLAGPGGRATGLGRTAAGVSSRVRTPHLLTSSLVRGK